MDVCATCGGERWVCEAHPDRPWGTTGGCECGAPGMPCEACNDDPTSPAYPPGSVLVDDFRGGGVRAN